MRVTVDGHVYNVPDDASVDEIDAITKPSQTTPAGPGKAEAFARGAGQGATLGFGDEIGAGVGTVLQKVLPESMGGIDYGKGFLQLYRENRDSFRKDNKAAKDAHLGYYIAGNLAGGAPAAVATGGGGALRLAASSAGLGAASALGESEAQDVGGNLKDAAEGGAAGLLLAGGLRGLGKAVAPLGAVLDKGAVGTARRVLMNSAASLSNKRKLSDDAVREALHSGAITVGGTSEGAASRLEGLRETVGDQYGGIVNELEKAGMVGSSAPALSQQISNAGRGVGDASINPAAPAIYRSAAEQVANKPTIFGPGEATPTRLMLSQQEQMKRSAQGMAKSAYQQMQPGEVGLAHEDVASMLRQSVEDEIARQSPAAGPAVQQLADSFVPVKDRLGRLIEASDVARAGMNRSAKRHAFSLSDIMMASGGMAHGGPLEAGAAGIASHLLRSRGPSTAARLMDMGAQGADFLTGPAVTPAQQRIQAILDILQRRGLPLAGEEAGALTQ